MSKLTLILLSAFSLFNANYVNSVDKSQDYVLILDTSISMVNNKFFEEVKKEIVKITESPEWSSDKDSLLYFWTFDSATTFRSFKFNTVEGKRAFAKYLKALRAHGTKTCIEQTLL